MAVLQAALSTADLPSGYPIHGEGLGYGGVVRAGSSEENGKSTRCLGSVVLCQVDGVKSEGRVGTRAVNRFVLPSKVSNCDCVRRAEPGQIGLEACHTEKPFPNGPFRRSSKLRLVVS